MKSAGILGMLQHMGAPYTWIGPILLAVPTALRNYGYDLFARNRGSIWKFVKRLTGMGDVRLYKLKDRIVGVEDFEATPEGWGLHQTETEGVQDE